LELLRDYVTGANDDVNVVLTYRNKIREQKLLELRWYEDLARKIGDLVRNPKYIGAYVLGSPGVGKSCFRLYLARHLASVEYSNGASPLALVFESVGKDASSGGVRRPFALLQPHADCMDTSWTIIRMRRSSDLSAFETALLDHHVVVLQDVSHGIVKTQFDGTVIRHSSNNKALPRLLREDEKDGQVISDVFFVPGNTVKEAMEWFETVVGRPPKGDEVSAITNVLARHGRALRNLRYLVPKHIDTSMSIGKCGEHVCDWVDIRRAGKQDDFVAQHCLRCEAKIKTDVEERLEKAGVDLATFARTADQEEEHLASGDLIEICTSFEDPEPGADRYRELGRTWRSNYTLQLAFDYAFLQATGKLANYVTQLAFSFDYACAAGDLAQYATSFNTTAGVRGRLFQGLFVSFFTLPPQRLERSHKARIRLTHLAPRTEDDTGDPLHISNAANGVGLFTYPTCLVGAQTCHFVRNEEDTKLDQVTTPACVVPAPVSGAGAGAGAGAGTGDVARATRRALAPVDDVHVSHEKPVLLVPYDQNYPGIDAVLLVHKDEEGKHKLALMLQVSFAQRHAAKKEAAEIIKAWKERLESRGFTVVLVFGVAPGQRYMHQSITLPAPNDAGETAPLSVPQYSLQWVEPGASGNKTDDEAKVEVDERLKAYVANEKVTCDARAHAACLWAVWLLNVAAGLVRFHSCRSGNRNLSPMHGAWALLVWGA